MLKHSKLISLCLRLLDFRWGGSGGVMNQLSDEQINIWSDETPYCFKEMISKLFAKSIQKNLGVWKMKDNSLQFGKWILPLNQDKIMSNSSVWGYKSFSSV